ncbi:winged helix-turn-helix transcriptional regulator [bacterium]|nr:winged helix-turn-helix transcriptional regulator [bacterium]
MNTNSTARHKAHAAVLKAMAHASRLVIIEALATKDHCVCELAALVGADMSTVSKHLSTLRNAGIISDTKRGTSVICHLKCPCVLSFLACVTDVLKTNAREQMDLVA